MGNSIKRFLALMLALVMVIGMMPANVVYAAEGESTYEYYAWYGEQSVPLIKGEMGSGDYTGIIDVYVDAPGSIEFEIKKADSTSVEANCFEGVQVSEAGTYRVKVVYMSLEPGYCVSLEAEQPEAPSTPEDNAPAIVQSELNYLMASVCCGNLGLPCWASNSDNVTLGTVVKDSDGKWTCEATLNLTSAVAHVVNTLNEANEDACSGHVHSVPTDLPDTLTRTIHWDAENSKWEEKSYAENDDFIYVACTEVEEAPEISLNAIDGLLAWFSGCGDIEKQIRADGVTADKVTLGEVSKNESGVWTSTITLDLEAAAEVAIDYFDKNHPGHTHAAPENMPTTWTMKVTWNSEYKSWDVVTGSDAKITLTCTEQVNHVAQIGETGYETLAEAFAAAEKDETVKLLTDLTIEGETITIADGKSVTLDMNGKKLTVTDNKDNKTCYELFYIYGKMTVTGNGTIELTSTSNDTAWVKSSTIFHNRGGELTIENGTFIHKGGTCMAFVVDNSGNWYGDATTNVKDGTLTSTYTAIRNRMEENTHGSSGKAILNVSGGTISGTSRAIWAQAATTSTEKPATGEINVSGGNVGLINTDRAEGAKSMTTISGGTVAAFKGEAGELTVTSTGTAPATVTILSASGETVNAVPNEDGVYVEDKSVAKIGETKYETLAAAIAAAQAGEVIEIIASELTFEENAASIVIDKAVTIQGAGKDATKLVFNSATSAFVIQSGNVTFQDMTIVQGVKDNSFHISVSKGAWDAPAIQYSNIKIENIAFQGGDYALCLIGENVTVNNCSFTEQDSHNIIVYSLKGDSKITNNTFNASKGNNKSAIYYEGGADNATDLTGFIGGGNLTISGNTANGKGVFFQFTNWKLVKGMNLAITGNKVDAFTNKAIALYDMDGAVTAAGDEFASVTVSQNVFTNVPSDRTILKEYTGTVGVDASGNYLGSATPDYAALLLGDKVTVDGYYADAALTQWVSLAVARIGDKDYTTLAEAMTKANEAAGEYTIELLADNAEEFTFAQNAGVKITIDGKGKTFSGKITLDAGAGELTITNATIDPDIEITKNKPVAIVLNASTAPNVTIENCTLKNVGTQGAIVWGQASYTSNKVVIRDCTASNLQYIVGTNQSGCNDITVERVTATDMAYLVRSMKALKVTIKNVTYSGLTFNEVTVSNASVLTMENVTVKTTQLQPILMNAPEIENPVVYTIVLDGQNSFTFGEKELAGNEIVLTADAEKCIYKIIDKANAVAKIGEEYYMTLAEAVAAGGKVELLKDVTLGENLTISGNVTIYGGKITRAASYTGTLFTVNAVATLTLDGGLTIDGGNNWTLNETLYNSNLNREATGATWAELITSEEGKPNASAAMFVVNGSVVANKVTIQNNYSTKDSNGGDGGVFKVIGANAALTMNGATVKHIVTGGANSVAYLSSSTWTINEGTLITDTFAARNGGVCRNDSGKIVMNGGSIKANKSINTNGTVFMLYQGTLEMTGGEICSNTGITGADNSRCAAVYLHSNGKVFMSGGSICHNEGAYGGIDTKQSNSVLTITGGSVVNNVSHGTNNTPDIKWPDTNTGATISGGTFTQDVSQWLDPECGLKYNAETGKYEVTNNPADGKVAKVGDKYYLTLQAAIDACVAGDNTVTLLTDSAENVTIKQTEGINITIDGAKKTYSGTITIHGNARSNGAETLTIKNLKFTTSEAGHYFIDSNSTGSVERYAHNVTVEGCYFVATGEAVNSAAAMRIRAGYNITVVKTQAENLHSLLQAYGCTGVKIEGVNIDGKNGISAGTSTGVVIEACNITATGYGIRADGTGAYDMTVKGNTIKAELPIVVRNATGAYSLTLDEHIDNKLTGTNAEGYGVIFTNGDDGTYEAPTGEFVLTGAENVNVYPVYVAQAGEKKFVSLAEAIAVGGEVTLLSDIELDETIKVKGTVVLNLNGKTITGIDNATGSFGLIEIQPGADLTINGEGKITLTSTNNRGWSAYSSVISNQRGKLTVYGGTIEHLGGTDMAYAIDNLTNGKGTYAETVINGGTIKSTYRAIRQFLNGVEAQNILTVNGGTIEGGNKSIWMQDANAQANPGKLTVSEKAVLNGDVYLYVTAGSTEWPVEVAIAEAALAEGTEVVTGNVPEGYELQTVNGTIGVVNAVVEMNGVYYASIYDALDVVQPRETATIKVLQDITITADQRMFSNYSIVINAEYITLDLNGKTITFDYEGSTATCYAAIAIYNKGTLTLMDSSEEQTGTIYNKTKIQGTDGPRILWVTTAGSATIEGGNYISEQGDTMFYASNSNMEIPTTLYIKDGYFEHTTTTNNGKYRYFNIQDGGGKEIIEVSGGVWAHNPTDGEMQFPEGFKAGENADGTWGVVEMKVASIGNKTYPTLAKAVEAAQPGQTIKLLEDTEGSGVVIDKSININFNGKTYTFTEGVGSTGTESNGFQILKGNTVKLTDGTLKVADEAASKFYILIQNYADLTLQRITLDGTNLDKWSKTDGDSYVLSNNSGYVQIKAGTKFIVNDDGDKAFAFDVCDQTSKGYELPTVKLDVKVDKQYIEAFAYSGSNYFASLQQAVNAGGTITVLRDYAGPGAVINNDVNVNFGGFTYTFTEGVGSTGTESNGLQILKGNTVVLRNGTLKVADEAASKFYTLIQNYADLSLTTITLDGTNLDKWSKTDGDSYTLSNNSGNVSIGSGTKIIANNDGALAFAFDACDKSAWGYDLPVVTVHSKATIEGNIEAAAKIGDVYYASLQQAIDAAADGKTITLVSDIKVDAADATKTSDNLSVMFAVEGKSLTLDMNGKTIDVDYNGSELLYGVIYVADGASLKVTGNGTIDVCQDGMAGKYYNVAYMFWKRGTTGSLIVENGTYHANNLEDSMFYTNGDEVVSVKGGSFTLDAVGQRGNGCPWIFNTKGQNDASILVSGGTYNFNVNAQHYAHEVDIVDANGNLSYVVDNGDGTWTVTGKTAEVGIVSYPSGYKRLNGYATFKDAVASIAKGADETTIELCKDITVKGQFIGHSYVQKVVIDLAGYTMSSTDKALTVYRAGTEVTVQNGTISGNTTGGTIQVTYGSKLTLGENVTVKSGGQATAIKVDANSTLIVNKDTSYVLGGKNDLVVAEGAKVEISAGYFKKPVDAAWCAEGYIPTEKLANGYYSVEKDPSYGMAAMDSNNNYYETLAAAIAEAQDGATITLLTDIAVDTTNLVTNSGGYATIFNVAEKAITVDLNGKKIDVTVNAADVAEAKSSMLMGVFAVDNNGSLTLTGNGSVTANAVDASMTSDDSHLYSLLIAYGAGSKLVVENGTYSANSVSSALIYSQYDDIVTIKGGIYTLGNVGTDANGSPWIFNAKGQNTQSIIVKGGTFNADILHMYYPFEVNAPKEMALVYNEETKLYTMFEAVAYVDEQHKSGNWYTNEVGYATLEEAIAAAGKYSREGYTCTVTLLTDIELAETLVNTETVILDLNGKTLSYTSDKAGEDMITNKGDLTITDSGENGNITYTNTDTTASNVTVSTISCEPGSVLEVKGGSVVNKSANNGAKGIYAYAIDLLTNGNLGDVTVTISGGSVISENYMAIRQFVNGESCMNILNVTGGTIYGGKRAVNVQVAKNALTAINDCAVLNISGGTIKADENGYAVCVYGMSNNISISGGNFVGWFWDYGPYYNKTEGAISGGTFDNPVGEADCAEGYLPVDNEDGTYTVKVDPAYGMVAVSGETYFETLAEALAAGGEIKLIADVELTDTVLTIEKDVTIDFNGHTVIGHFFVETNKEAYNGSLEAAVTAFVHIKGGEVVLKGNGGLTADVGEYGNLSNLIRVESAAKLTIDGGNYTQNLSVVGAGMIDSRGDKNITINGGTFYLGNVGSQANGSPWMLNTSGKNTNSIVVKGGTFNADVNHQYWAFEVDLPGKAMTKDAETGLYEVVPAVANVTEKASGYDRTVGYATLEEAFTAAGDKGYTVTLLDNIALTGTVTIPAGKTVVLDLNGKTIAGTNSNTATSNDLFMVKGNMTVKNGTVTMTHTGTNMGWNGCTNVFDVTAGGVLNIEKAEVKNLGGTDMNFGVHLNNWGEVTLNVKDSTISGTYCAVRVFNSGFDMNNVTIENSTLSAGGSRAFWVHNYIGDLDATKHPDADVNARLNLDIYGNGNTFEIAGTATSPIRYGMSKAVYFTVNGERIVNDAEGLKAAAENGNSVVLAEPKVDMTEDIEVAENSEFLMNSGSEISFDGNGNTITTNGTGTAAGESYDYGYVGFIPANGEDATVENVTVTGSGFVEVGHYGVSTKGDYIITSLTVKDLVATLAVNNGGNNIAAAFSHYGNATMTDCVMTGTSTEKEGFKPYDAAFVNGTTTNIVGGKYGVIYLAHQAHVTITGAEIETIDSCAITAKNLGKLTIGAGAKIGTINLTPGSYNPSIVIEEGAEVGAIVYNGVTYTVAEWNAR